MCVSEYKYCDNYCASSICGNRIIFRSSGWYIKSGMKKDGGTGRPGKTYSELYERLDTEDGETDWY